jgi:AhpD family alkylhydroperoxidase
MIKYIQAIAPRHAEGFVEPVYAQIKRDFGKNVEPFLLHSPIPELLAGAWMACRETELVGSVPRYIKEAVAIAVSQKNQCPYCIDAHTFMHYAENEKELSKAIKTAIISKSRIQRHRQLQCG